MDALKSKQMLSNHLTCSNGLLQAQTQPLIGSSTPTTTITTNNSIINNNNNNNGQNCDNISERSTPNSMNSFLNSPSLFNSPNRITQNQNQHQQTTPQSPLILSSNSTNITSNGGNNNNNSQSSIFFPPLPARSSHHQLASTLVTTATSTKIVDRSPKSADINMNAENERNRESSFNNINLINNQQIINSNNSINNLNQHHHHQRFSSTASQQSSNLNSPIIMPAKSFAGFFTEANTTTTNNNNFSHQQPIVRRSINLGSSSLISTLNSNSNNNIDNWPHQQQQNDDSYHLYHEPIDPDDVEAPKQNSFKTSTSVNQSPINNNNNNNNRSPMSTNSTTPPIVPPSPALLSNCSRVSTTTPNQATINSRINSTIGRRNDVSADIYFCYVSMKSSNESQQNNQRTNQRSRSYHGPKNSLNILNISNKQQQNQSILNSTSSFVELPTTPASLNSSSIINNNNNNNNNLTMRDYCINELIGTEMNYTHALNHILTYFAKPLEQYLRKDENQLIFGHMKYFYNVHTTFQAELVKHAPNVSNCFLNFRDKFLRYGEYCATLSKAQTLLDDIVSRNELFSTQLDRCHHEANEGKFKLADLLSLPMQRILKYHLLLAELIKNTRLINSDDDNNNNTSNEYNNLKRAHEAMIDLGKYINEAKRDTELMQIIDDIEQSISGLNMPSNTKLTDYGRLHIDGIIRIKLPQFTVEQQNQQFAIKLTDTTTSSSSSSKIKQKRYAFVFDKVLLMCKVSIKGYQYKEALVLSEYVLDTDPIIVQNDNTNTISAKHLIREKWTYNFNLIRTLDQTTYSFYAKDLDMKNSWIEAIQKAFDNIRPFMKNGINNISEHEFLMHTFERASSCDYCGKLFHGVHYQGYRCRTCFASVHKNCLILVRPCGPTLPPKPINNNQLPQINLSSSQSNNTIKEPQLSPSIRSNSSNDSRNFLNHSPCPLNELSIKDNNNNNIQLTTTTRNETINNYVNFRLNDHLWFCGRMERDKAQALLQNMPDGTFLVRVSPKHNGSYVISLNHNSQVKHMRINVSKDNELYLSQNRYFKSVIELVSWYEKNSLVESFHMLDARLAIPYKANQSPPIV